MLLFRSEEHIQRWCSLWHQPVGGIMTLSQAWGLANGWYREDRRQAEWRRKTKEEAKALLDHLGLTSGFWQL
jgi:hypothetical protein